eukprot:scaffold2560_cov397-Prasinococcus_capsulatus_cf.AAC.6
MYPFEQPIVLRNTSQVDVTAMHTARCKTRFPRFEGAIGLQVELRQGDVLLLPPRWWHFVMSLDTSCSVSLWF